MNTILRAFFVFVVVFFNASVVLAELPDQVQTEFRSFESQLERLEIIRKEMEAERANLMQVRKHLADSADLLHDAERNLRHDFNVYKSDFKVHDIESARHNQEVAHHNSQCTDTFKSGSLVNSCTDRASSLSARGAVFDQIADALDDRLITLKQRLRGLTKLRRAINKAMIDLLAKAEQNNAELNDLNDRQNMVIRRTRILFNTESLQE